ncbi:diacylglycerol kinase [Thalassotalea ganghwensis]
MEFDNTNKPQGIKRLYLATFNSLRAFKWLVANEAAFRQELILFTILVPSTFWFNVTPVEQLLLILSLVFILFTEIFNTAIEVIVDRIGLEIHPLSGLAKDLGSAAVMISIFVAITIWGTIFLL